MIAELQLKEKLECNSTILKLSTQRFEADSWHLIKLRKPGVICRRGWDNLMAGDAQLQVHSTSQHNRQKMHSPSYLPRLLITPDGVSNRPSTDLRRGPRVVVPPLFNEKANGRKETPRKSVNCSFQQPVNQLKCSNIQDGPMIPSSNLQLQNSPSVRQEEHEGNKKRSSRTWSHSPGLQRELAACSFFRENKSFAWNFLDSFILEVLRDELVPDILMEVLSGYYTKTLPDLLKVSSIFGFYKSREVRGNSLVWSPLEYCILGTTLQEGCEGIRRRCRKDLQELFQG
ncbi:uncharacterized protein LOC121269527 isoform X5 [Carcharodon carcharias]|uniref:uncharacterized protein LOC121269527 isoform X5 n=1 Tax=Carcharodon carcharias TaxID=13397 RepID=UPI001B7E5AB6|nr:uncharacterized protein LOC121269527 isoform X5 [Carcharodon carcharias]